MELFISTWAGVITGLGEWLTRLMDSPLETLSAIFSEFGFVFSTLAVWFSVSLFFPLAVIYLCSAIFESVKLLSKQGQKDVVLKDWYYAVGASAFVIGSYLLFRIFTPVMTTSTVGEVSHALQGNVASTTSLMVVLMTFVVPYVCYLILKKLRAYNFENMSVTN